MTELDEKIRQALEDTGIDTADFDSEEDSLRSLVADAYQGKLRWIFVLATFWQLVLSVIFVYAGIQFFGLSGTEDPLFWATIFLMSGMGVSMIKIMHWMLSNRNRLLREIKRLELEVARLGKRVVR